jgi:LuxR family maltose regulon positive regulatory protein
MAPAIGGTIRLGHPIWLIEAHVLDALARDALGDAAAAERALERAMDLAQADHILSPFVVHPVGDLMRRHLGTPTNHVSMAAEILDLLDRNRATSPLTEPDRLPEPLSRAEIRVLRYLPTRLSAQEIARELYVSQNTVKTHMRRLYTKLDAHNRRKAVERASTLGLLAAPPRPH